MWIDTPNGLRNLAHARAFIKKEGMLLSDTLYTQPTFTIIWKDGTTETIDPTVYLNVGYYDWVRQVLLRPELRAH